MCKPFVRSNFYLHILEYLLVLKYQAYGSAGSVTPLPQPGNPKPRVFRLPELGCAPTAVSELIVR